MAAGREFHFASPRWGMFLEVSVSKNIASRNRGYANGKEMRTLTVLIDDELDPVYRTYAYIPSVNVGITYRFVPGTPDHTGLPSVFGKSSLTKKM
jgi:hypothetical protein